MNILDFGLLVTLGAFVLLGFWLGIIHMVGAVAGVVVGVMVGGYFGPDLAPHLLAVAGGNLPLANIVAFTLLFGLATRLVALAFWAIEQAFNVIAVIPFLKTFNRLLGAVMGFLEGMVSIGLVMFYASRFPFAVHFTELMQTSTYVSAFMNIGGFFAPLLPTAFRALQSAL